MNIRWHIYRALIAVAVLPVALALSGRPGELPPANAQGSPSGCGAPSDPSVQIQVTAGSQFVIALASNPTTGYGWTLAQPPDQTIVQPAGNQFVPPAQVLPGAGGEECWTFTAIGPGETTIGFEYRRPFEPPTVPAAQTESFDVLVLAASPASCSGETDPSLPILASAGQPFTIALAANHTTPFAWRLELPLDETILQLVGSTYVPAPQPASGPPIVGAGGTECWTFMPVASGETVIALGYATIAPGGGSLAKVRAFVVIVQ